MENLSLCGNYGATWGSVGAIIGNCEFLRFFVEEIFLRFES